MNTPNRKELNSLPTWRGVKGTRYIWHGEWSDPEIYYRGRLFNAWDIEEGLSEDPSVDEARSELECALACGCGRKYEEGDGTYGMDMEFRKLFAS